MNLRVVYFPVKHPCLYIKYRHTDIQIYIRTYERTYIHIIACVCCTVLEGLTKRKSLTECNLIITICGYRV